MNISKPKANRIFRSAVLLPTGVAVLAAAVVGGLLLGNSKQAAVVEETPTELEFGYTGFDRAVSFAAAEQELLQDGSSLAGAEAGEQLPGIAGAEAGEQLPGIVGAEAGEQLPGTAGDGEHLPGAGTVAERLSAAVAAAKHLPAAGAGERQPESQLLSSALSAADRELLEALQNLDARAGVAELNQRGYASQQSCGAQPWVEEFALPDNPTQAIVTPQNAGRTAADVAAAVQEYYQVQAQVYHAPGLVRLFCLARVTTLPKLEWKWHDLRELVARQVSVEFLQPLEVRVVGLLTGHAVTVACLPPGAYGQLSLDDKPIVALLLLRWAGGRWRVSTVEDFPGESCQKFTDQTRQRYASDTSDTGEGWILF